MSANNFPSKALTTYELCKLEHHELLMQDTHSITLSEQFSKTLEHDNSLETVAALERFRWLAGNQFFASNRPTDPLLNSINCLVNPDYITTTATNAQVDMPAAAGLVTEEINRLIERLEKAREHLAKVASIKRYTPKEFEPSIFGGLGGNPNTDWCLWFAKETSVGLVQAHTVGLDLMKHLAEELPRIGTVDGGTPKLIVMNPEFRKAGIKRGALSFAWVIHRKYTFNLDWETAHSNGIDVINSLPESEITG